MNNRNSHPLRERVEEIQQWLAGRLDKIKQARHERADELAEHEARCALCYAAAAEIDELVAASMETIAEYERQIAACNDCIAGVYEEIDELKTRRREHVVALHTASYEQQLLRKQWAQKMRLFQDGKVRRRRRDLEKLQRRIAAKERFVKESSALPRVTTAEIAMGITPEMKAKELEEKNSKSGLSDEATAPIP